MGQTTGVIAYDEHSFHFFLKYAQWGIFHFRYLIHEKLEIFNKLIISITSWIIYASNNERLQWYNIMRWEIWTNDI